MVTPPNKYAELTTVFMAGLRGDSIAYEHFLRTIAPLLRRTARRKLSENDVEDVVQEILISIHKARHTYDDERPLIPWIMAIAQFRITDQLRKYYAGARYETVDVETISDTLADVTLEQDTNESIEALLIDVPEREKRILTLMHVEGFTAKETGVKLGMKESAVKVAAHRAIKKIRHLLGGAYEYK